MATSTYNITKYARCETEELQLLEKHKVSGTATRVYLVLRSLAREKSTCFPSLKTIANILNISSKSAIQIISNALAKLVECGLVQRNNPKSKQRFYLKSFDEILQRKSIKRNRETTYINENIYRTEPRTDILSNKQNKHRYKGTKKANNNGYSKHGGFDGGINQTHTDSDLHPIESLFKSYIENPQIMIPEDRKAFENYMMEKPVWKYWVMAFHSGLYEEITGKNQTQQDKQWAYRQWERLEMGDMKTSLVGVPQTSYRKPTQSLFDKLLNQMRMK